MSRAFSSPTDGSDYGKTAIAYGISIAGTGRATDGAARRGRPPHAGSVLPTSPVHRLPPYQDLLPRHRKRPSRPRPKLSSPSSASRV